MSKHPPLPYHLALRIPAESGARLVGKLRLLLVEDSRDIALQTLRILSGQNFDVTFAEDGQAAWELLTAGELDFEAIILDRELPRMSGMDLLKELKAVPRLGQVPVIMVTSSCDEQSIRAGLEEGAYYYITKPFEPELLASVVSAAVSQYREYRGLQESVRRAERPFLFLEKGIFRFRSLDDARVLANSLARACPNPEKSVIGIEELFINAIEHGNLGIGYQEKTRLLMAGTWMDEVSRRLASPEGRKRFVTVNFERLRDASVRIEVKDDGDGFDWHQYVDFTVERAFDNHGRGIAMARALSFDSLQYVGNGNTVVATIKPTSLD